MIKVVYVEKAAYEYEKTYRILSKIKNAVIVGCDTWEEVFYKRNQNYHVQKTYQQLIIGVNRDKYIFEGSSNCQSFGADNFFYCGNSKNCVFNCDYCYLSGMLKSGNLLAFVNVEDCFREASDLFRECEESGESLLMPISYDNDAYALENLFGYVSDWGNFLKTYKPKNVTVEIRTKCGTKSFLDNIPKESYPFMCMTWSIAPKENIRMFEKKASPLSMRLDACQKAINMGIRVRLALDPVIAIGPNWKDFYKVFFDELDSRNLIQKVEAIGVGGFRIPTDYLKTMKHNNPCSGIAFDNYVSENGTSEYTKDKQYVINSFIRDSLIRIGCSEEKIYFY